MNPACGESYAASRAVEFAAETDGGVVELRSHAAARGCLASAAAAAAVAVTLHLIGGVASAGQVNLHIFFINLPRISDSCNPPPPLSPPTMKAVLRPLSLALSISYRASAAAVRIQSSVASPPPLNTLFPFISEVL
jgi:hypothetical protein